MASANETLVRRWFEEIWNRGDSGAADELLAPRAVLHEAGIGGEPSGRSFRVTGMVVARVREGRGSRAGTTSTCSVSSSRCTR
jgi:hypothetical protein